VVRGTRITVESILRKISEGTSEQELLDAYPRLTTDDIKAAIRYAADTLAHEGIPPRHVNVFPKTWSGSYGSRVKNWLVALSPCNQAAPASAASLKVS
jgi:Protein of unknown function (DUF433)